MDYKKIGKRIRKLRQQQGYTQETFAEAVDFPRRSSVTSSGQAKKQVWRQFPALQRL